MSEFRLLSSRKARPAQRVRPRLETLEERSVPTVTVSSNINGINYTGYQPPDTTGASGYYTTGEAVNLQLTFWDKSSHAVIYNQALPTFFNSILGGVLQGSDPVMAYDIYTQQYIVGMLDYNNSNASRFDLAVSRDDNPNDGWTGARYNMNDGVGGFDFADYPKLGFNGEAYVATFNMFPNLSSFNHVNLLSIDKTNLANSHLVAVPGGSGSFTVNPVVDLDHAYGAFSPLWLVQASGSGGSGNSLRLQQVSNLTSSPTFGSVQTITVPAFSAMARPRQPGGSMNWTFDTRLLDASEIFDQILVSQNEASGGNDRGRVYQVDISTGTAYLEQTFSLGTGSTDTYFPSAAMNYYGDIGISYMQSSSTEAMSMYVTGQSVYDAGAWSSGVYQTPVRTFAGSGSYTSSRAGDYSRTVVDGSDYYSFWAFNEYKGSSTWGTGLSNFYVTNPAPPPGGGAPTRGGSQNHDPSAVLPQTSAEASDLALLLSTIGRHQQPISDAVFQDF